MTRESTGSTLRSAAPTEANSGASVAGEDNYRDAVKAYYEANGYVVVRDLIPGSAIDHLLEIYSAQIIPSRTRFFRQNTNRYERNELSSYGYVEQSFLDIHAFGHFPLFARAALDIFCHQNLLTMLSRVTGSESHNLMQSMLFDMNTHTQPHQDWWYLDSVPAGNLIAAWIALEDIHVDAGRFYVLPKSQRVKLHEDGLAYSEWKARMRAYADARAPDLSAPKLRKGDVLFWNSRTIHGSFATLDRKRSRKSLTAHFLPAQFKFGNLFTTKEWVTYRKHGECLWFANQPEYSLKASLVSAVKNLLYDRPALLRQVRRLQRGGIADY